MLSPVNSFSMMALRQSDEPEPSVPVAQSLIARAKLGERDAFEELFVRYQRQVLRTASRILGNPDDARDAAQEVFLRLHKYLHRFNEAKEFSPWLYQVTVNVCREIAAKRQPYATLSFEQEQASGTFDALVSHHDLEREVGTEQERRILNEALAILSEKERAALVLRDIEGLETREVARLLGSSETTVRSQISMARVKIKRYRDQVLNRNSTTTF